jgi:transposase
MSNSRRHFSDSVKADAVRRHLSDKIPVSDLADELKVQPSLVHLWVKQVLDQAEKAFDRPKGRRAEDAKDRKITQLQAKLANKNEVISELMEENVKAKKANGEL